MTAATGPSSPRRVFDLTGSDASTRLHDFGAAGTARSTSLPPSHDFGVASRAASLAGTRLAPTARAISDAIRDSRIATTSAQQTPAGALGTNGFFDCCSRKAAWRSSTLLPLLQCSLRDL